MMPEDYVIYVPDDQLDAYAAALKDANGAADHLHQRQERCHPRKGKQ